jgi:hypothetical protein
MHLAEVVEAGRAYLADPAGLVEGIIEAVDLGGERVNRGKDRWA